jgi:hypothetical protein
MTVDGVIQSVLSADEDREGGFEAGGWVQRLRTGRTATSSAPT